MQLERWFGAQRGAGASVNDAENVEALRRGAQSLTTAAGTADGQGAKAAKRLAQDLTQLADAALKSGHRRRKASLVR